MKKHLYYLFLVLIAANAVLLGLSVIGAAVEELGSSNMGWSNAVSVMSFVCLVLSVIGAFVCCLVKPKKDKKDGDGQEND